MCRGRQRSEGADDLLWMTALSSLSLRTIRSVLSSHTLFVHTCLLPMKHTPQGHQIRIDIASSSFPRYDINYGITNEEAAATTAAAAALSESGGEGGTRGATVCPPPAAGGAMMRVARNTIYSDVEHPSHIAIPMRKVGYKPNCTATFYFLLYFLS